MAKMKKKKKRRVFVNEVKEQSTEISEEKKLSETMAKSAEKEVKTDAGSADDVGSGQGPTSSDKSKTKKRNPDIKALERYVLERIIGQDKQVRQIITAIYRGIYFKSIKSNTLIIGSSGVGKTAIIEAIANRLNKPYTIEDATKYTQEGYYGADVEDMIYNLLDNTDWDVERAQNGIIVIDEIDKKKYSGEEHDVSGVEVLNSLLKIIEGTVIKVSNPDVHSYEDIKFDTKNIIIIFAGAFRGLEKIRDKRLKKDNLGFRINEPIKEDSKQNNCKFVKQDLINYGLPEEFVGRIDTIVEMNNLTKEDLALILKKSKLSIFGRYQKELKRKGVSLQYKDELFDAIAEKSLSSKTGARDLSNTVNYIFENICYDVFANRGKYKTCILDLDIVNDNTKYQLL